MRQLDRRKRPQRRWALQLRDGLLTLVLALVLALALVLTLGSGSVTGVQAAPADRLELWTSLQLAVLDRLNRPDDDDPTRAGLAYRRLADRLQAMMVAVGDSASAETGAVAAARQQLDTYWQNFNRIVDLRRQRDRLNDDTLQPISVDIRLRLQRLTGGGRPVEAGIAGDAVISMLLVQHYADRYVVHRDVQDLGRARLELEAVQRRLDELGRMPLELDSRTAVGEVGALVRGYDTAFGQLGAVVAEEARLIADGMDPGGDLILGVLSAATPVTGAPEAKTPQPSTVQTPLPVEKLAGALLVVVALVGGGLMARRLRRNGAKSADRSPLSAPRVSEPVLPEPSPPVPLEDPLVPLEDAAPPTLTEPERIEPVVADPVVAATDWLVGVGRTVAMLHADSTELARLREQSEWVRRELLAAKHAAEARSAAMARFLQNMGDRLQGPLETIVRHGDHLMSELDRHRASHLGADVEVIQWSSEQLLRLIEGLGALAAIESGTLALSIEDFLVEHLVVELREWARPLINLYGNRLDIQAARNIGLMHTDFSKVRAALCHLIENACKFTENGNVTLLIMRVEEDARSQIRFTVMDTGIGIPTEYIDRVFEPFVRFGPERGCGAGVGLALVHHYALRLGGSVVVDSRPGRGCCFVLTLPAVFDDRPGEAEFEAVPTFSPVLKLPGPPETRRTSF